MFGGQPTQQVAKGGRSAPARATISTGPCFVAVGARSVLGVAKLGWVLLVVAGGGGCLTDALPRPCVPAAAADQSEEEEEEARSWLEGRRQAKQQGREKQSSPATTPALLRC